MGLMVVILALVIVAVILSAIALFFAQRAYVQVLAFQNSTHKLTMIPESQLYPTANPQAKKTVDESYEANADLID